MLSPKEIAQHDGIGVLGNEYLSTSCVKGKFNKNTVMDNDYLTSLLVKLLTNLLNNHCP